MKLNEIYNNINLKKRYNVSNLNNETQFQTVLDFIMEDHLASHSIYR